MFKLLSLSLKQQQRSQLSSLWVWIDDMGNYTKNADTRKIFSKREEVHKVLLDRNSTHLQQAATTPFARGRLKKGLKWDSTGPVADAMISGDILNETRFKETMQLYLECIKVKDFTKLNTVRPTITLEEYQSFWRKKT